MQFKIYIILRIYIKIQLKKKLFSNLELFTVWKKIKTFFYRMSRNTSRPIKTMLVNNRFLSTRLNLFFPQNVVQSPSCQMLYFQNLSLSLSYTHARAPLLSNKREKGKLLI